MTPYFKEHCTKVNDVLLIVICFFFSHTNLVFKSKLLFIDILDSFSHRLFTFLPLDFWYSEKVEFEWLYTFFIKTFKILMRFNILSWRFSASKCSYYVLFSMKHSYLLTAKVTRNNYLTLLIICNLNMSCKSSAVLGI